VAARCAPQHDAAGAASAGCFKESLVIAANGLRMRGTEHMKTTKPPRKKLGSSDRRAGSTPPCQDHR
jgi:hypothetical protein